MKPATRSVGALAASVFLAVTGSGLAGEPPVCAPGEGPLVLTGTVDSEDLKSYVYVPFVVPADESDPEASPVTRIELGYSWKDLPHPGEDLMPANPAKDPLYNNRVMNAVLDLGLWDGDGPVGSPEAFRGWSGDRQGQLPARAVVAPDRATRTYRPERIRPGIWKVELGVAALGLATGADWRVEVECFADAPVPELVADFVDPDHVATDGNDEPKGAAWYHGDFHMHGYHSNPNGAWWEDFVPLAKAAGLDFFPVTEYVTNQHWRELGPFQRANPDVLIWPGREIITYHGHAISLGETPNVIDYRHGFDGVHLRDIQRAVKEDGALFGVAHPTIWPGPALGNFCRGCEFTIDDLDWACVDTIEVLTGPIVVDSSNIGFGGIPGAIEQPFVPTAIRLWEEKLLHGYKVTAVSGSDDKPTCTGTGPARTCQSALGSSATAVRASALSREAIVEAVTAGRAYVRTQGVAGSPSLEMTVEELDGTRTPHAFGAAIEADAAWIEVDVSGADGQRLRIVANGVPVLTLPIVGEDFHYRFLAERLPGEGPLGTFWRVETERSDTLVGPYRTTIGNPVFLVGDGSVLPAAPGAVACEVPADS